MKKSFLLLSFFALLWVKHLSAQDNLLAVVDSGNTTKEYVTYAFKSSRVINNHSIEFIGKGILDVRILHRFGLVNEGVKTLFGLDQASIRFGFDYGLGKNLTIGVGRSTIKKELDGFIKYRPLQQSKGLKSSPVSIVLISGITLNTLSSSDTELRKRFTSKISYYHQILIGRKFTNKFSLQLSPTFIHRNLVSMLTDDNNTYAIGVGARLKLNKRVALVTDYHYVISGLNKKIYTNPLSVGFDIETGGHVFQLHFSNSRGLNEKEFITNTTDKWGKGEIRFGFNLSRVFTIKKPKAFNKKQ